MASWLCQSESLTPGVLAVLYHPLLCVVTFIRHEKTAQLPLSTQAKL